MNALAISSDTRVHYLSRPFPLESGVLLSDVAVAYRTWGHLAADGGNAVLVCHALTGSADVDSWWPQLLGPGHALDPTRDFVVCSNVLGSCYGTIGPTSARRDRREVWGPDFPNVTVRDMVRLQGELLRALGVRRLRLIVGGSLGGMQALEWVATSPSMAEAAVVIAAPGRHSAWATALSEAQRAAIRADARFMDGRYTPSEPPRAGLAAARMIAMCSYRSPDSFALRFGRDLTPDGSFEVERYLRHQGEKLVARFDANTYLTLSLAMDSHDISRGRGEFRSVLRSIHTPTLVVSIDSDVLYPPAEVDELAALVPDAELAVISSPHGHDAFLIEANAVDQLVLAFRARLAAAERRRAG